MSYHPITEKIWSASYNYPLPQDQNKLNQIIREELKNYAKEIKQYLNDDGILDKYDIDRILHLSE